MIKLKKLSKSFGNRIIFNEIDLDLNNKKSIYCIIGESGCGKTTLFQILFGLDFDFNGEYYLNGKNVKEMSTKEWDSARSNLIQFVFQDFNLLEHLSVYHNLMYTLNEKNEESVERVNNILEIMDLKKIKDNIVSKISGGEKQRLALARAVINNPEIILLDEPTGNLDDKNAENVMRYISKLKEKDVMILIITHDARVLPYADYSLKIENKKIISDKKQNNVLRHEYHPKEMIKKRVSILKYTLNSLKSNFIDVIIANIPIATIFIIFLCLFNVMYGMSIESMDTFFNGVKEDTIYISSSNFTDEYVNESKQNDITPIDDGTRIAFSNEDIDDIKEIIGVHQVFLYNGSISDSFDNNGNRLSLQINKDNLPNVLKESPSYTKASDKISFRFETLTVPSKAIDHYNPKNIVLLGGSYPTETSAEILLPDFYIDYLIENGIFKTKLDAVGHKIAFDIIHENGTTGVEEYTISGYYQTNYNANIHNEYLMYLPYKQYDFLDLFLTEEEFLNYRNHYIALNEKANINESLYKDFNSYKKAIGTNLCDLIIITDSGYSQEKINAEIAKIFPNLKQISQYEFMHGSYRDTYNKVVFRIVFLMSGIAIIFGIIIVFINKNYIKRRNKEMAILYSLGYSREQVIRIIVSEYAITTVIDYLIAIGIVVLAYNFFFKYQNFGIAIGTILDISKLIQSFIFILIITLISILFSIVGIKKNKLNKYLQ